MAAKWMQDVSASWQDAKKRFRDLPGRANNDLRANLGSGFQNLSTRAEAPAVKSINSVASRLFMPNKATRDAVAGAYQRGGVLGVLRGAAGQAKRAVQTAEPTVRAFTRYPIAVLAGAKTAESLVPKVPTPAEYAARQSSSTSVPQGGNPTGAAPSTSQSPVPAPAAIASPGGGGSTDLVGPSRNRVVVLRPDGTEQIITQPTRTASYAAMVDKDGNEDLTAPMPWNTRAFIRQAAAHREASLRAQGYNLEAMAGGATVRPRQPGESLPMMRRFGMTKEARKAEADAADLKREKSITMRMLADDAKMRDGTERYKADQARGGERDKAKAGLIQTSMLERGANNRAAMDANSRRDVATIEQAGAAATGAATAAGQMQVKQADALLASFQERVKTGVPQLDKDGKQIIGKDKKPLPNRPLTPEEMKSEYQAIGEAMGLIEATPPPASPTRQKGSDGKVYELVNGKWVEVAA